MFRIYKRQLITLIIILAMVLLTTYFFPCVDIDKLNNIQTSLILITLLLISLLISRRIRKKIKHKCIECGTISESLYRAWFLDVFPFPYLCKSCYDKI